MTDRDVELVGREWTVSATEKRSLDDYETAVSHYHRQRRRGGRQTTRFWAREVRRLEAAIGAAVEKAGGLE